MVYMCYVDEYNNNIIIIFIEETPTKKTLLIKRNVLKTKHSKHILNLGGGIKSMAVLKVLIFGGCAFYFFIIDFKNYISVY